MFEYEIQNKFTHEKRYIQGRNWADASQRQQRVNPDWFDYEWDVLFWVKR